MDTFVLLLIALPVAALITWRLLIGSHHEGRHERAAQEKMSHDEQRSRSAAALDRDNFQAMSIRISTSPCKAALAMRGQTFLMNDAPSLPLQGCDRACHCEFAHHSDRRINPDRRYPAENVVDLGEEFRISDASRAARDSRKGSDRRRRRRMEPYQGIY